MIPNPELANSIIVCHPPVSSTTSKSRPVTRHAHSSNCFPRRICFRKNKGKSQQFLRIHRTIGRKSVPSEPPQSAFADGFPPGRIGLRTTLQRKSSTRNAPDRRRRIGHDRHVELSAATLQSSPCPRGVERRTRQPGIFFINRSTAVFTKLPRVGHTQWKRSAVPSARWKQIAASGRNFGRDPKRHLEPVRLREDFHRFLSIAATAGGPGRWWPGAVRQVASKSSAAKWPIVRPPSSHPLPVPRSGTNVCKSSRGICSNRANCFF